MKRKTPVEKAFAYRKKVNPTFPVTCDFSFTYWLKRAWMAGYRSAKRKAKRGK